MAFERCGPSLTLGDLADVEAAVGRPLPRAFTDHYLLVSNGGWPPEGMPSSLGVHGFLPLTAGEGLEIPFAYDAGGNQFVLVLDPGPARNPGLVEIDFAGGAGREPTGLTVAEFLAVCHAEFLPPPAFPPTEEELTEAVATATRTAVEELLRRWPDDHFYYFTLITTGEAHPPYLSACSTESTSDPVLKWSAADSPFCLFGAQHFEPARRLFAAHPAYEVKLRAMESGLRRLDAEGLFPRPGAVLTVEVLPPDATNTARARRLNPPGDDLAAWLAEAAEPD